MPELYVPVGYAVGRLVFRLTDDPEEMSFTIGLDANAAGGSPLPVAVALTNAAQTSGSILDTATELFTGWTYVGARVSLMTGTGFVPAEVIVGLDGTTSGETLPVNVSVLVKKSTDEGGNYNRGRMYLPPYGLAESVVSKQGMIDSSERANLQGKMDAFLAELQASAGFAEPVLLHYPRPGNATPTPTPITALTVQERVATQRRRLR